ncbi:MAG: hypothetical protein ACRDTH_22085 [Pseudonocardiaceae bacterium]
MSSRKSRARARALAPREEGLEAARPSQGQGGEVDELLGRLQEEREEAHENRRIWRAFREAPGWATAVLLVLATAVQLLVAAKGNSEVAIAVAGSIDTSRLFLMAAVMAVLIVGGVAPFYFGIYWRYELALRYRDIALAKASGEKLYDERILSRRLRGGLFWLISLIALSCSYVPAVFSVPLSIMTLLGVLDGVRSPFSPWRFWDRLKAQGHLELPSEQLCEVIKAKVELSNQRRANGAFVIVALAFVTFFTYVPGAVIPFQNIKLANQSLVGYVLGTTPAGLAVLAYEPRRVLVVNPSDVKSADYCTFVGPRVISERTLLDIVQGDRPWKPPPCG